jgi:hypothetical protein
MQEEIMNPKERSDADDLYEALFYVLSKGTPDVHIIVNVLMRMLCAISVEHGIKKSTLVEATGACFDATAEARVMFEKFESDTPLQ